MRIVHRLLALTAICLFGINSVYAISWDKDIESGLKKAQEEKKCVFLLFTGSDWCPYCITLEKEVLKKSVFKDYAEDNLILVMYDKRKKTSKSKQKKIKDIMQKYGARGFPTIVILDPDNKELGKMGTSDDPDKFVSRLKQIVSKYSASEASPDTAVAAKETVSNPAQATKQTPEVAKEYPNRTWTNLQGKKVKGTLVRFDKESAVIKNRKGKKSTVPRSALSAEDNTYLDSINSDNES